MLSVLGARWKCETGHSRDWERWFVSVTWRRRFEGLTYRLVPLFRFRLVYAFAVAPSCDIDASQHVWPFMAYRERVVGHFEALCICSCLIRFKKKSLHILFLIVPFCAVLESGKPCIPWFLCFLCRFVVRLNLQVKHVQRLEMCSSKATAMTYPETTVFIRT